MPLLIKAPAGGPALPCGKPAPRRTSARRVHPCAGWRCRFSRRDGSRGFHRGKGWRSAQAADAANRIGRRLASADLLVRMLRECGGGLGDCGLAAEGNALGAGPVRLRGQQAKICEIRLRSASAAAVTIGDGFCVILSWWHVRGLGFEATRTQKGATGLRDDLVAPKPVGRKGRQAAEVADAGRASRPDRRPALTARVVRALPSGLTRAISAYVRPAPAATAAHSASISGSSASSSGRSSALWSSWA